MISKRPPPPAGQRPGRKRSPESRAAILSAAVALFREVGYAQLTVEGIAARAGVGKQTIYRWWPTRTDVLLEALADDADLEISVADHGSYAADLRAFLADTYRLAETQYIRDVLGALMAQAQLDAEFGARFRSGFLERRRAALRSVVDRAAMRGDLPRRPAPNVVLDLVFGTLWYRVLATQEPFDDGLVEDLLALLAP